LRIWEVATGKEMFQATFPPDREFGTGVTAIGMSPDNRVVAFGLTGEDRIRLWELASGTERAQFAGHTSEVTALSFATDVERLASGSADTTLFVWDLNCPTHGPETKVNLTEGELVSCWNLLAHSEGREAAPAIWRLVADTKQAVPFLKRNLTEALSVTEEQLRRWITELSSDSFRVREKATLGLTRHLVEAWPLLEKARQQKETSLEARVRINDLLKKSGLTSSSSRLLRLRSLEVLERIGTPEAREVIESVARTAADRDFAREARDCLRRLGEAGRRD
jgi:hypothetical protein